MTDNEIIKELNLRIDDFSRETLDLINRQKAEIERLREIANHKCQKCVSRTTECAKSEAIKEFAERLKEYELCMFCSFPNNKSLGSEQYIVLSDSIDDLVKEMKEVNQNDDTKNSISDFDGNRSIRQLNC